MNKNAKFELWEGAMGIIITTLGHKTIGSELIPIFIIDMPDLKGLSQRTVT